MQPEPLITWSEPVRELAGFIAQFLALGAVGFRFAAVRGRASHADDSLDATIYSDALQHAATIGVVAIAMHASIFLLGLPAVAARAHLSPSQVLMSNLQTSLAALFFGVALLGFELATFRVPGGWPLALLGSIVAPLTAVFVGQWSRLVNPLHRIVAGLWLGTLFILVVAGLTTILREAHARERRGAIAADMVNGFSPLALTCGVVVIASGLTTAYTHLKPLSSLWTTPYGYALLVKLALVAGVFGLGAWNWRRVRPTLGTEDAAHAVRRSSRTELSLAALVLGVTAILISLPSPKASKPAPTQSAAPQKRG